MLSLRTSSLWKRSSSSRPAEAEISNLEKTLLKLAFTEKRFFAEITERKLLRSATAVNIADAAGKQYKNGEHVNIEKLKEDLDESYLNILEDIDFNVQIRGKEEEVLKESIQAIETADFEQKERELMYRLSLAEEEGRQEDIEKTMKEIADLQKEINNRRGAH